MTSSKASFALGAPLKKVRRSEEDTRSDTPQGRPSVETSDPVLGPKREAAADDDNEVINIFDSINGDVPPQYHNLSGIPIKIYHYWLPFSTQMVKIMTLYITMHGKREN